jgi:hypothetical protein
MHDIAKFTGDSVVMVPYSGYTQCDLISYSGYMQCDLIYSPDLFTVRCMYIGTYVPVALKI